MAGHDYTLYSYFCSSCAARVRIALNVKSIGYDIVPVRMAEDEHLSDAHRALNPSCTVPLLVCHAARRQNFRIGQSVAALEYLDETHPSTPLLPPASDPETRAAVRMLVGIVCCDIQPVTNLRIKRRVGKLGGDAEQWNRELMVDGLRAYEGVAREWAGRYSVGDEITLADVCFMPAWWNAERVGAELGEFELLRKLAGNLQENPAIVAAGYTQQPDTPEAQTRG